MAGNEQSETPHHMRIARAPIDHKRRASLLVDIRDSAVGQLLTCIMQCLSICLCTLLTIFSNLVFKLLARALFT